jgi:hypothetical protein
MRAISKISWLLLSINTLLLFPFAICSLEEHLFFDLEDGRTHA